MKEDCGPDDRTGCFETRKRASGRVAHTATRGLQKLDSSSGLIYRLPTGEQSLTRGQRPTEANRGHGLANKGREPPDFDDPLLGLGSFSFRGPWRPER